MKVDVFFKNLCKLKTRRSRLISFLLIAGTNFLMGIIVMTSVVGFLEKRTHHQHHSAYPRAEKEASYEIHRMTKRSLLSGRGEKKNHGVQRENLLTSSDFYFRLELRLLREQCSTIEYFNTTETMRSIEEIMHVKFNEILDSKTSFAVDVLRINPTLKKKMNVPSETESEEAQSLCDYILFVDVVFYFSLSCDNLCRATEIQRLILTLKTLKDHMDTSWSFPLISQERFQPDIRYQLRQIKMHRISKFQGNVVYIKSVFEDRFLSAFVGNVEGSLTSVIASIRDKSLFKIEIGLDQTKYEEDPSSIFVSFLSNEIPNTYLRHQLGRIKLSKIEDSALFRQDATFKLIENYHQTNVFAFESTNIPHNYISIASELKSALVLTHLEPITLDGLNNTFLFRFIHQH